MAVLPATVSPDLSPNRTRKFSLRPGNPLGIPKEDCLILEDSFNGIRAAYDAGIEVIMIPDLIVPDDEAKAKTIDILPDLS